MFGQTFNHVASCSEFSTFQWQAELLIQYCQRGNEVVLVWNVCGEDPKPSLLLLIASRVTYRSAESWVNDMPRGTIVNAASELVIAFAGLAPQEAEVSAGAPHASRARRRPARDKPGGEPMTDFCTFSDVLPTGVFGLVSNFEAPKRHTLLSLLIWHVS
jgi:hypothetical protein